MKTDYMLLCNLRWNFWQITIAQNKKVSIKVTIVYTKLCN